MNPINKFFSWYYKNDFSQLNSSIIELRTYTETLESIIKTERLESEQKQKELELQLEKERLEWSKKERDYLQRELDITTELIAANNTIKQLQEEMTNRTIADAIAKGVFCRYDKHVPSGKDQCSPTKEHINENSNSNS